MADGDNTAKLLEAAGRQHAMARKLAHAHLNCVPPEIKRRFLDVRAQEAVETGREIGQLRRDADLAEDMDRHARTLEISCGHVVARTLSSMDEFDREVAEEVPVIGRATAQDIRDVVWAIGHASGADVESAFPEGTEDEDFERELVDGGPSLLSPGMPPGM